MTGREVIAEALRNGRRYTRSFKDWRSTLQAMVRDGEVHHVSPPETNIRNMVELTGRGWVTYFGQNLLVSRLDNFAELVAKGFDPADAGRELFLTRGETARAWANIRAQLGRQAA